MPLVVYTANISPLNGTGAIKLSGDRFLKMKGTPVEVSDAELAQLRSRFVLDEVEDQEESEDDDESETSAQTESTPTAPASPTPSVASSVNVGSAPSSPAPVIPPNSPTPAAGN